MSPREASVAWSRAGKVVSGTSAGCFRSRPLHPVLKITRKPQDELSQNARPELAEKVEGMDAYDPIYIGYPNWWGTMPMALFTFLETYDFSGKTSILFCTHEGSGMGSSACDIKTLPAGKGAVRPGD